MRQWVNSSEGIQRAKFVMVDPTKITNFHLNQTELEEVLLFWVCAAGKNGVTAAKCLDNLLSAWLESAKSPQWQIPSPFDIILCIAKFADLPSEMKKYGIGCYNAKSKTFQYLAKSRLDLQKCTLDDLEKVPGIGPKTARCFLIHSRKDQQYAGLDVHCLKFLRDKGHDVPKSTPTGKKYRDLEIIFLKYANESGMSVADFDLMIWNRYRNKAA
jgi:hypothetical protein